MHGQGGRVRIQEELGDSIKVYDLKAWNEELERRAKEEAKKQTAKEVKEPEKKEESKGEKAKEIAKPAVKKTAKKAK